MANGGAQQFDTQDIPFRTIGDRQLLGRLYRPRRAGPCPAVVDVHGGAWTKNDRLQNRSIDEALAASGIVVFAIDFRMPPEVRYPVTVADVNYGIRWFKRHAAQYGSAERLVGVLGSSSGGQLAMLNALRPTHPDYCTEAPELGGVDASVAFATVLWPVIDPLARYRMVQARGDQGILSAHHAFFADEAAMAEGNPQMVLDRGEAERLPPALLIQGTADDNLTPDMPKRFAESYAKAGGRLSLHMFKDQPHTFISRAPDSADAKAAIGLVASFVHEECAAFERDGERR